MIRIALASVYADDQDQDKAIRFYTDVPGFVTGRGIPSRDARELTVAWPSGHGGIELLREPDTWPVGRARQQGLFRAGVLATGHLDARYERLTGRGFVFAGSGRAGNLGGLRRHVRPSHRAGTGLLAPHAATAGRTS